MKQRKPMSRGKGFSRPAIERKPRAALKPLAEPSRAVLRRSDGAARLVVMPKSQPVQHEGYMRIVRQLNCEHCGRAGPSQFCHSDEGKGGAIKSDCRFGWPGCADRLGELGCHSLVGTKRIYGKEERRRLEDEMSRRTRHKVRDLGLWPKGLEWIE